MSIDYNSYNIYARVCPAIILMIPIAIEVIFVMVILDMISMGALVLPTAVLVFFGYILIPFIRNKGVKLQEKSFVEWGGPLTTRFLRYKDLEYKCDERIRMMFESLFTEFKMPTEIEEQADPSHADKCYEEFIAGLRDATRDKSKYPILFDANKMYGFIRNLIAIKWDFIALSVIFMLINVVLYYVDSIDVLCKYMCIANGLLISCLLVFLLIFKKSLYKKYAENYLDKLINGLKILYHDKQETIVKR